MLDFGVIRINMFGATGPISRNVLGEIGGKLCENLLTLGACLIEANLVPLNFKLTQRPIFSFRILPPNPLSSQMKFQIDV